MLISIHSGFIRYKNLAHDQIRASYWTIWLMNINDFWIMIKTVYNMVCHGITVTYTHGIEQEFTNVQFIHLIIGSVA